MSVLKGIRTGPSVRFCLALLNKLILWLVLLFCLALKLPSTFGTLVAGLSIANLFLIAPDPAGLGIVKASAVSLVSLGVPVGDSTVVTVVYRAATFVTLLVGMYTFRQLHLSTKQMLRRRSKARKHRLICADSSGCGNHPGRSFPEHVSSLYLEGGDVIENNRPWIKQYDPGVPESVIQICPRFSLFEAAARKEV